MRNSQGIAIIMQNATAFLYPFIKLHIIQYTLSNFILVEF